MPYPEDVSHHFIVDPSGFDFYAMDCYRTLGEGELARAYAQEVIRSGTDMAGRERSKMRNSEARITLGVVAAQDGDIEEALSYGHRALDTDRQSLPPLLMVSGELDAALEQLEPAHPDVWEYRSRLRSLRAAS